MRFPAWLAWRDLGSHRRQPVALGIVFAVAVASFLALDGYREALARDYPLAATGRLVVQEAQSFGEFYGSRISPEVAVALQGLGIRDIVPEIHAIVGTSLQDAVLLKGVDLEAYPALDAFDIRSGRGLQPGDPPRSAMIGLRLAERLALGPGQTIRLRGRSFEVVGVFETGAYTENEAWVPLAGAQDLLGWDHDVSLYVVPDDEPLTPGQSILDGVSVARRGELWSTFPRQWQSLLGLMAAVTRAMGLAAALFLAAMLWRLAWRRRRQMAILRTLGFPPIILTVYLAVQGAVVALGGGFAGGLGALVLLRWARPTVAGVSLRPELGAESLLSTAVWLGILTVLSVVMPVWALGRRQVAEMISAE